MNLSNFKISSETCRNL